MNTAAWMTLLSLAMIWGASFLAYAIGLRELPIFTLVAHRVFWGCLALWLLVWGTGLNVPRGLRIWGVLIIMGILNNAIPFSLVAFGQQTVQSGLASILNSTNAFFTILLAAAVFADERLSKAKLFGTALSFVGVVTIIGWHSFLALDARLLAIFALLSASLSYAFAAVWARAFMQGVHPITAAAGMLSSSSVVMVLLALCFDGVPQFDLQLNTWVAVLFLALPATAIAYLLYYRALRLAGSGNLGLVTLLIVPSAMIWGALILDERLSANAYIGFILIGLGMVIVDGRLLKSLKL